MTDGDHFKRVQPRRDTFPEFWGKCPTGPLPFPFKARYMMHSFSLNDVKGIQDIWVPCTLVSKDSRGNKVIEFGDQKEVPEIYRNMKMVVHPQQVLEVFF